MRWIILVSLVASVATCGQKGPLTLPEKKAIAPSAVYVTNRVVFTAPVSYDTASFYIIASNIDAPNAETVRHVS